MKKLLQLPIKIFLILSWLAIATTPVRSQSGNMSDITMPNPGEITPDTSGDGDTTVEDVSSGEESGSSDTADEVAGDGSNDAADEVAGDGSSDAADEVAGDGSSDATDEVAGDGSNDTADEVAGDGSSDATDEVAGDGSSDATDEVAGDGSNDAADEVAGDGSNDAADEVSEREEIETPMEESITVEEDILTEEVIAEEDVETPAEEVGTSDRETETPSNNTTNDNDAVDRIAVNEDIMEAIANGSNTPDPDVVSSESDLGLTLGENTAGTANIIIDDNVVTNFGEKAPEINNETQLESVVETENIPNIDSDVNSQPVVENSVEQNVETANTVDSQPTIDTTNDLGETNTATVDDSVETETVTNTDTVDSEVTQETTTNNEVVDNSEVTKESITTDDSVETETVTNTDTVDSEVTQETTTNNEVADNSEVTKETATTDDSVETETVTNTDTVDSEVTQETTTSNEVADSSEVTKESITTDDSAETETVTDDEVADDGEVTKETATTDDSAETETVTDDEVADNGEVTEETEEVAEETTEETEETEEVAEETEETEEEVSDSNENSQDLGQEVDRIAYEVQVQEAPTDIAIQMQEEFQLTQLMDTSGIQLYGQVPSVKDISNRLAELGEQTGKNPAFVNISLQSDRLEAFVVLPNDSKIAKGKDSEDSLVASADLNKLDSPKTPRAITLRETVKDTSRKELIATATQFREEVSDSSKLNQNSYLKSSQELYKVLIEPIEAELEANNIDILVFSMDSGLRLLPLAALHDGEQFLIEKYAVAIVPSFGLTDTRYVSLDESSILAMGASEFVEQASLPTMPIELETIVSQPRQGEVFINEQFTVDNFKAQNQRETPFPIVHLGTHAEFKAGSLSDSYIQFYDDKLKIPQLQDLSQELGWNSDATPIELLVLSACETALGDEKAELGFAGLAVQAGVKSALASLWYVSDVGTLALMGEFYDRLDDTLIKAEALRQTQLKMLQGNVKVNNKQVNLSNGQNLDLPPEFPNGTLTLDHPYFWSAFTLIGNWN